MTGEARPGPARLAVGVSGAGSNLRALHEAARRGEIGGDIVLVFADRPCPALDWAAEEGIDTALVPGGEDAAVAEVLAGAHPDVVVLAGYMRVVRATRPRGRSRSGSSTSIHPCCQRSQGPTRSATRWQLASP
jgi:folate-dependent phosphoribosylglycinamide formyltransferase PurN